MTDLRKRIYPIVKGRVATYGQVAAMAGVPRHALHVGFALHDLPEGSPLL